MYVASIKIKDSNSIIDFTCTHAPHICRWQVYTCIQLSLRYRACMVWSSVHFIMSSTGWITGMRAMFAFVVQLLDVTTILLLFINTFFFFNKCNRTQRMIHLTLKRLCRLCQKKITKDCGPVSVIWHADFCWQILLALGKMMTLKTKDLR